MNINRIKKNIKKVEEIVENIDVQDVINRMEIDRENSIEEDIILLNDFAEGDFQRDKLENYKGSYKMGYFYYKNIQQAIEHILLDYKRVLKENEELKIIKSAIQTLQINSLEEEKYIVISKDSFLGGSYKHLLDDYIPKQKVKDIIDRINYDIEKTKEIISKNTNIYASYRKNDYQIVRLRAMNTKSLDIKKRLQELLESEE